MYWRWVTAGRGRVGTRLETRLRGTKDAFGCAADAVAGALKNCKPSGKDVSPTELVKFTNKTYKKNDKTAFKNLESLKNLNI